MKKFQAVLGTIITLGIGVVGLNVYQGGTHVMTWFGIRLNQVAFIGLFALFLVIDIFALKNAFGAQASFSVAERPETQALRDQPAMQSAGQISITRTKSMLGAAMGVRVFLNGVEQGVLKNGKTLTFPTYVEQNELLVHYDADHAERTAQFRVTPGGHAKLQLKYNGARLTLEEGALSA